MPNVFTKSQVFLGIDYIGRSAPNDCNARMHFVGIT